MASVTVRDLMKRPVVYIRAGSSLRDLMDLLRDKGISGVPVVDDELRLVGVISEADLIRRDLPADAEASETFRWSTEEVSLERTYRLERLDTNVEDVMNPAVITCDPDDDVQTLCRLFHENRIHRVVVMERGEVAGIVTPMDVATAISSGVIHLKH